MELSTAITRLVALAHEGRLRAFREIVQAERPGIAAGDLADKLKIQPNTLSAQLNLLSTAGLIGRTRKGRSMIYQADLSALNALVLYLIEDCCDGRDEVCSPILDAIQSVNC